MEVTEFNAARYSDNYAIQQADEPNTLIGCEHNQQEAEAIAKWLTTEKGQRYEVIRNSRSAVDAAKKFRKAKGLGPVRFEYREEALQTMGVWPRK